MFLFSLSEHHGNMFGIYLAHNRSATGEKMGQNRHMGNVCGKYKGHHRNNFGIELARQKKRCKTSVVVALCVCCVFLFMLLFIVLF